MTLWWVANAVLFLVVIPAVVVVGQWVVREALAAKRHAEDIRVHGTQLTAEADGLTRLEVTGQRVRDLRRLVAEDGDALIDRPAPAPPPRQVASPPRPRRGGPV